MGEKWNACRILVGKQEGKRPLGKPKHWWVNNIKLNLLQTGWGDVDWIDLAQNRYRWRALVNLVINFRINKMLGYYLVVSQLVASRVVLSSI
jgi:hypothetical protein